MQGGSPYKMRVFEPGVQGEREKSKDLHPEILKKREKDTRTG